MSDDATGSEFSFPIDRRSVLLILGAFGGCLGNDDTSQENIEDEDDNEEDPREDVVTISESGDGESTETQLSASELITSHIRALDDKGYESELNLTDLIDGELITKEITYGETANRSEMFVEESMTLQDGISSLRYEENTSGSETIVELDSGEVLNADIATAASQVEIPVRITGASVYNEFLMGATLTKESDEAEGDNEEASSTSGTYSFTDHDRLSLVEGDVTVDTEGMIESFSIVWNAEGVNKEVSVEMSEIGSIAI